MNTLLWFLACLAIANTSRAAIWRRDHFARLMLLFQFGAVLATEVSAGYPVAYGLPVFALMGVVGSGTWCLGAWLITRPRKPR